jgi:DNA polymerase I-like protein with 3'-5' exonuclease and polymerase domains
LIPVTLDFETEAIVGNPLIAPPKPVGLAVRYVNGAKEYITDWKEMAFTFQKYTSQGPTLFHNAPFDLSVARRWFGIPWPHWRQIHETMYLLYHDDPYAKTYSLKPSAERVLGIPPEEQNACREWILKNVPQAKASNWGAFLCLVPVPILAPYAMRDVEDTFQLFAHLYPKTQLEPYERERRLMPILADATIKGVRVNRPGLEHALELCTAAFEQADQRLRTLLNAPGLNPSSTFELANALDDAGYVDEWVMTPGGSRSTAMKTLRVNDGDMHNLLKYRSTLKTYLSTFLVGWLEKSNEDGRLHPNWNSTRGDRDGGTRTGRLSSSDPNFQNVPNPAELITPPGLPDLPHLRDYILPEEGHAWAKRDFSAQEIRLLAHFEDGELARGFNENPLLDPHEMARQVIFEQSNRLWDRKKVKTTAFGMIYGMGAPALSASLEESQQVAKELAAAYKRAIPGVQTMQDGTKRRGRSGQPIRTWGGRLIHVEPSGVVKGEWRSFEYKLLNYLIQGSAADQTKQCIINWVDDYKLPADVFMATVHDEINISVPLETTKESMEQLRLAMEESCAFDVPMRSEGFIGPTWGEVEDEYTD